METAERRGDRDMAGWGRLILGRCEIEFGNDSVGIFHFERALAIFADFDGNGIVLTLSSYATALDMLGRPTDALPYFSRSLVIAQRRGLRALEATIRFNLANLFTVIDKPEQAKRHLEQSLKIRAALDDSHGVGSALGIVAAVSCRTGELAEASRCIEQALNYLREAGDRFRQCNALLVRSEVHLRHGAHREAVAEEVLSFARADRYRYGEAAALRQLAKAYRAAGDHACAADKFAEADEAYRRVKSRLDPVLEKLFSETDPRLTAETTMSAHRSS